MITSTGNQQMKNLVQLQKKAKVRRQQGIYVVEGIRMFREVPEDQIVSIYVSESFYKERENQNVLAGKSFEILSDSVFAHVSDTQTPQGILCLVKMPQYDLSGYLKIQSERETGAGIWLLMENIQDPGNLGTMFRTGEGAGVAGIIMDRNTVDIFNPKTIRSTMGAIYRVPFFITDSLAQSVELLKKNDVHIYAAHLEGSVCYDEPDYTKGCGFLIGNEGNGLTDETASLADSYIHIPMGGKLESLNAAMAAGILMYEANRQRRKNS